MSEQITHCWSEVSTLLARAMPKANVTKLYREGTNDTQNVSNFFSTIFLTIFKGGHSRKLSVSIRHPATLAPRAALGRKIQIHATSSPKFWT